MSELDRKLIQSKVLEQNEISKKA